MLQFRLKRGVFASLGWLALLLWPIALSGQDLQLRQLKHRSWGLDDGVPERNIAIAQLPDGRLLVGGQNLYTFDGLTFKRVPFVRNTPLHDGITSILALPDGTAWIGYRDGGVALFKSGVLRDVDSPATGAQVRHIVADPDGGIWFLVLPRIDQPLVRYKSGRWSSFTPDDGLPEDQLIDVLAASSGRIWVTSYRDVYVLDPQSSVFKRYDTNISGHGALAEDSQGRIWLSDDRGTRVIFDGGRTSCAKTFRTPGFARAATTRFAEDGSLWGSTGDGLFRLPASQLARCEVGLPIDRFRAADGLTSDRTVEILSDREGAMWVVTATGLDQFQRAPIVPEPMLAAMPRYGQVLASTKDGNIVVGAADAIYRIVPHGNPEPVLTGEGEPEVMCELSDGSVIAGMPTRMVRISGKKIVGFPKPPAGPTGLYDCVEDRGGRLWVASAGSGLFEWTGTGWRRWDETEGNSYHAWLMSPYGDGIVLYHSPGILTALAPPHHRQAMSSKSQLLDLETLIPTSDGVLLASTLGLARLSDKRTTISSARAPWLRNVRGLAFERNGTGWMLGRGGLVKLAPNALGQAFSGKKSLQAERIFNRDDGLPGNFQPEGRREVAIGGDGRVWMLTTEGAAWLDPAGLPRNLVAPGVSILRMMVDGETLPSMASPQLMSGVRRVEFDFSVASLANPARNIVQYRLTGVDENWVEAGQQRSTAYTNLGPGEYTFQVIAANNDGVWNREGAEVTFTIPPTFTETLFFRIVCLFGAALLTWIAYRIRLSVVAHRINERMEERLAERERIARELHDTLLQGFQGLLLRFQAVVERMDPDQPQRPMLESALDRAETVLVEGRDKVRHLRNADPTCPLSQALKDIANDVMVHDRDAFSLTVIGKELAIASIVREEIIAIGGEAIRNSARHADAQKIECVLAFNRSEFQLTVCDDGKGIPAPFVSSGGRQGHFGLTGMRERAEQIGAKFSLSTGPESGTKISVSLRASIAYETPPARWQRVLQKRQPS